MDAFDEAMFSLALREEFELVRMFEGYNEFHPPAQVRIVESVSDLEDPAVVEIYIGHPPESPDDQTKWMGNERRKRKREQWFDFLRSYWLWSGRASDRWAFKPPTLEEGRIATSWYPEDKSAEAIVKKVWRILGRLTTNLFKPEILPDGTRVSRGSMGPSNWYGHHALEWCRSDPKYMLNGRCHTPDHWELPQNGWYQDLRQRVIERYGADFGKPEPPEELDDTPNRPSAFRLG